MEYEGLVERQIREAMERGEFDDLEGAGRPIPDVDGDYDPLWWVRSFVQRTRAQDAAWDLRRTIRREQVRLAALDDPAEIARRVRELNALIVEINAHLPKDERIEPITDLG